MTSENPKVQLHAKTTIIVPYHFRAELEEQWHKSLKDKGYLEQDPLSFSDAEPHAMTLARAWAQRQLPNQEDTSSQPFSHPDEPKVISQTRQALAELPHQLNTNSDELKAIKARLIEGLDQDQVKALGFDLKKGGAHRLFDQLSSEHTRFVSPLWKTLAGLDLNTPKVSKTEALKLISGMRQLIDDELNTHMVGNGMSAALKRLWSVETESAHEEAQGAEHNDQLAHPLSSRCLLLSASDKLTQLWGDGYFYVNKGKERLGRVKLARVINVFCHKNNGFLCFTFELLDLSDINALQQLVYGLVRTRSECTLEPESLSERPEWHAELMPEALRSSAFSLRDLTQWLIAVSPQEASGALTPRRLGDLRKWIHHTSVHLSKPVVGEAFEELRQACWMLSRAIGSKRKAPPLSHELSSSSSAMLYDDTLVESSVEGACVFTWESQQGSFDSKRWALENFQGIYYILHLHIRGEEAGLQDFSHQSLKLIRELRPLTHDESTAQEGEDLKRRHDHLKKIIKKLKKLILEMVYFNISFNSASAGGYSDHMSFLNDLREVHSIDQLRDELKTNISELNELVDRFEAELRDAQVAQRDEEERLFNRNMSILGAIAVPFGLLSGLMGMNTFDTNANPLTQMGFWSIVIASFIMSLVIVVLIQRGYNKGAR